MAKTKYSKFLKKRAKKNPEPAESSGIFSNPPSLTDITGLVLPGVAGYVANRFSAKLINGFVGGSLPAMLGKHVKPAVSTALGALVWWLSEKTELLKSHREGVVAGTGVAVLQSLLEAYMPAFGTMLGFGALSGGDGLDGLGGLSAMDARRNADLVEDIALGDDEEALGDDTLGVGKMNAVEDDDDLYNGVFSK